MDVLFVSSEVAPWSKTGGLGDVASSLPAALAARGHRVAVVTPRYGSIDPQRHGLVRLPEVVEARGERAGIWARRGGPGAPDVYFLEHDLFYGFRRGPYGENGVDHPDNPRRFAFLARAALDLPRVIRLRPAACHFNDWQSALGPWFLRAEHASDPWLAGARSVFTIHNLAYQGMFGKEWMDELGLPWSIFRADQGVEFHDQLNFMKGGLAFADALTTVSPHYAHEILTVEGGYGLDTVLRRRSGDLFGILNGIDVREWDPSRDPHLPAHFDRADLRGKVRVKAALQAELGLPVKPHLPLIGMVGRLADQKGVDLVARAMPALLRTDAQFALLGSGQAEFEDFFRWVGREHPGRFAARIGFDEGLAHRIEAGADLFLMPSRFEPCGLNQMYSLRYGTPPVARAVGGLVDTVQDYDGWKGGTGFLFGPLDPAALVVAVRRALDVWRDVRAWRGIQERGMSMDFSWGRSAERYEALYLSLSGR
ncbi:MAG TPA: glycogen synthase GlgA [Anaeromyxobacteraceae bacterium]|nr:glycogen synthase GlgA [Anaeromyxobacteraceae bacterium]